MATSPREYLRMGSNTTPTDALLKGFSGWILAAWGSFIAGFQAGMDLLILTPVDVMTDVVEQAADAFFIAQFQTVIEGARVTANSLLPFGITAQPLSIGITIASLSLVVWYLRRPETSDFVPGALSDLPGPLGTEESDEN